MNTESRKIIRQYKTQIIVLLFALVSLFISVLIIIDLIKIQEGKTTFKEAEISKKSQMAAIIVAITTLYFVYTAFQTYMNNKTKANYAFLIAAILVLIAAGIRLVNIIKNAEIEGAEDIVL